MPVEPLNGIDLYYESHGEGEAIVFLHGATGNHISWWQQIPSFSQRYRCITIDHRGFGRSTDPGVEGAARFVDDLEALLERLGVDRAALVAQSMGGRTALGFAVRHPERVSALVMCDTTGSVDWDELRERQAALRDEMDDRPLSERAVGSRFQRERAAETFLYRQIAGLNPPRERSGNVPGPSREDVEALRMPALFIAGSDDLLAAPEVIRVVQALIPHAEYLEFPGCGHSVYFEDPVAFNDALGNFFDAHLA